MSLPTEEECRTSHHVHNNHRNMMATPDDDGGGTEKTLSRNKEQYDQRCRLMFNNTKLETARKKRAEWAQLT